MIPTQKDLHAALNYNPKTGLFTWKRRQGSRKTGDRAGSTDSHGHVQIVFGRKQYMAHRLAWLYVHGAMPDGDLDHRDGKRSNNSIANLRPATRTQNIANSGPRADNKSGLRGVSEQKGRWKAQIQFRGKKHHIGLFGTKEEAKAAYALKAREFFGEFAR